MTNNITIDYIMSNDNLISNQINIDKHILKNNLIIGNYKSNITINSITIDTDNVTITNNIILNVHDIDNNIGIYMNSGYISLNNELSEYLILLPKEISIKNYY